MKNFKSVLGIGVIAIAGFFAIAADHIEAPAVKGGTSDITDYYAFQGQNTNNMVFVANVQGLLSPAATGAATFDENVMVEFNIDTSGDNIEDLVIQAIPRDGKMYFFGPIAPSQTGLDSTVLSSSSVGGIVDITPYGSSSAIVATNLGMSFLQVLVMILSLWILLGTVKLLEVWQQVLMTLVAIRLQVVMSCQL